MRWILYFAVPLILSSGWFLLIFLGTEGNRTDNGDVCFSIGRAGQYSLSLGDWSCDPSWFAIGFNILFPAILGTAFVAAIGETVRWGLAARPKEPRA